VNREQLESARGHFERAVEIDPRFASAFSGLATVEAEIYRNFGSGPDRLSRAEAFVQRALLDIDPGLVSALLVSAKLRGVRYDYPGAAERFRQVVALEPRNYLGWDYLCWVLGYLTPPRIVEAEQACRTSIAINPGLALAHYHLARVLIGQGRLDEGLAGGYRDLPDLRSNPYLEPFRRDPRFDRMLAKHGIQMGPAR